MQCLALNADFSSPRREQIVKEACGGASQRRTSKSGYFTAIRSFSVKTAADRRKHTAYHNKH